MAPAVTLQRRTPLKRSGLKRGGRINPVSDKRRDENAERRDVLLLLNVRANYRCEVCPIMAAAGHGLPRSGEPHQGQDGHEPLLRSRGGSITDLDNMLLACRIGHDWVHAHPRIAQELGLMLPSRH